MKDESDEPQSLVRDGLNYYPGEFRVGPPSPVPVMNLLEQVMGCPSPGSRRTRWPRAVVATLFVVRLILLISVCLFGGYL